MRKLKVLERLFYRPLLDEERSHMPREMVERLFPNLEEVSSGSRTFLVCTCLLVLCLAQFAV